VYSRVSALTSVRPHVSQSTFSVTVLPIVRLDGADLAWKPFGCRPESLPEEQDYLPHSLAAQDPRRLEPSLAIHPTVLTGTHQPQSMLVHPMATPEPQATTLEPRATSSPSMQQERLL